MCEGVFGVSFDGMHGALATRARGARTVSCGISRARSVIQPWWHLGETLFATRTLPENPRSHPHPARNDRQHRSWDVFVWFVNVVFAACVKTTMSLFVFTFFFIIVDFARS